MCKTCDQCECKKTKPNRIYTVSQSTNLEKLSKQIDTCYSDLIFSNQHDDATLKSLDDIHKVVIELQRKDPMYKY